MNVLELDTVQVDENNLDNDLDRVVKRVKPNWLESKIKHKKLTGGYMNTLYQCWPETETHTEQSVVVRINGNFIGSKLVDRPREIRNLKLLNSKGIANQLVATFSNGIVYSFVEGQHLDRVVTDWNIISAVAEEMAIYHQISYDEVSAHGLVHLLLEDKIGHPFKYVQFHIEQYPSGYDDKEKNERFQKLLPSKEELQKELKLLNNHLEEQNVPLVMCHNDVWGRNIIYNKQAGTLHFIDYEDTGFSYAAYDMAYFFCSTVGVPADFSRLADKEYIFKFLNIYLEKKIKLNPKISSGDIEQESVDLFSQIHKCILVTLLLFTASSLVLDRLYPGEEDFMGFSILSYKEYQSRKEEYLQL